MTGKKAIHWKHDDLALDLARQVSTEKNIVGTNLNMGPAGSVRPDVYTIDKSYSNPRAVAFEIKVSRSDFLSDVTAGKWQEYLKYAGAVIFACPEGLLTKNDVPEICGLIVRKEKVWRYLKRPRPQPCKPPFEVMMKLLIDGRDRSMTLHDARPRASSDWALADQMRKQFGDRVADVLRDIGGAEARVQRLREEEKQLNETIRTRSRELSEADAAKLDREREKVMADLEVMRREAARTFGLPEDTHWANLRMHRHRSLLNVSQDAVIAALNAENRDLRNHISHGAKLAEKRGIMTEYTAPVREDAA